MTSPVSHRGARLAKIGAWLQLSQLIGLFGSMVYVHQIKQSLPATGVSDPVTTNDVLGQAFIPMIIGMGFAVVGVILVIIAATVLRYRASWFFWFLCIYGAGMTLSHMMPFGLFLLVYALLKRNEFEKESPLMSKWTQ